MTKTNPLSRRKLLGRIGLLAAAGYTVPALTTLSVAQAASSASAGSNASEASTSGASSSSSAASEASGASNSGPSGGTVTDVPTDPVVVEATCGVKNLNDPAYLQCLVDNGF